MKKQSLVSLVVFSVVLISSLSLEAADIVKLTVSESTGSARRIEPVTSGIPLARSLNIKSTTKLRLVDSAGRAVPAQFTPLARWGSTPTDAAAPIKWLLVDFQVSSLAARQKAVYTLRNSGAQPSFPTLTVTEQASTITIKTGAATFIISKQTGRLSGTGFKSPLIFQAVGSDGTSYSASKATDVDIVLQGKMRVSIRVKGQYLSAAGKKLLEFTNRYWFYAGQSYIRLFHTVENNTPGPLDEYGQISCYDIGSAGSVRFRDISLVAETNLKGTIGYSLGGDKEVKGTAGQDIKLYQDSIGTAHWNLYPTIKDWDGKALDAKPRMQAYVSFRGYKATAGTTSINTGQSAQGWLIAGSGSKKWAVAVRDFWKSFPKALRLSASKKKIEVGLFPDEFGPATYSFCLRAGEHKTHEILFDPACGNSTLPRQFSNPLLAAAASSWYLRSGALGRVGARNTADFPLYEKYIDYQLTTSPDYEDWFDFFPNIFACLEGLDFYGIFDYGDVPLDYEGYHVSPMNLKYNMDHGMWVQWLRGGDARYFALAEAADRHIADLDILHFLHKPRHWSDGIMIGHSYHDEEGFKNPHRNYGGASCDLAAGIAGMIQCYYLTGYEKAWEAAVELADCFYYRISNDKLLTKYFPKSSGEGYALMEYIDGIWATQERPAAHCINAMVAAYAATADTRYLNAAHAIVGWADPAKQPYINGPTGKSGDDDYMSPQFLNYYCKSLGFYLDTLAEFKQSDKYNAAKRIVTFQNFMRTYVWVDVKDIGFGARAGYPYRWYFNSRSDNKVPDLSSWLTLGADAMILAYEKGKEKNYLDRAKVLFRTGTNDPAWEDDANTYTSTKEMANAVVFGNNFIWHWTKTLASRMR
ncbi:MAG: hypothetical protein MUQ00_12195 [Candidatus Aminicenantes bacterium]|nr:hypothetical protein [Candidatus Aminicenantes bacterium]